MNSIIVETDYLLDAANKIEAACNDYENTVSLIYKDVDRMSSCWKGEDNTAFTNQIMSYKADFNRIALIIREYVNYLRNSANAYKETQAELTLSAGRLRR